MRYHVSLNLAKPTTGLRGYLISKWFMRANKPLELAASQLCNIQQHHNVLEVGYGPGLGLKEAFKMVSEGSGMIHGIDISPQMHAIARKNLKHEIRTGKIELQTASVIDIPYPKNKFDCIFHCDCYYFWPDMDCATKELHRVIKPDKKMVATLNLKLMQNLEHKGFMQFGNVDPDRYMRSLETNGFTEVNISEMECDGKKFEAIIATAKK